MMPLASVDKSWGQYDGNRDGTQFPSRRTKFHKPSANDPGLAACSSRIVLNDDVVRPGEPCYPSAAEICRRCIR